jgi:F0F1-type ATP synthase membrane subunit b/b'
MSPRRVELPDYAAAVATLPSLEVPIDLQGRGRATFVADGERMLDETASERKPLDRVRRNAARRHKLAVEAAEAGRAMLADAKREAAETIDRARAEAATLLEEARAEAKAQLEQVQAEAHELARSKRGAAETIDRARAEAATLLEQARAEAKAQLEQVQAEAHELARSKQEAAETIGRERAEAAETIGRERAEAAKLLDQAREKAKAHLEQVHAEEQELGRLKREEPAPKPADAPSPKETWNQPFAAPPVSPEDVAAHRPLPRLFGRASGRPLGLNPSAA